MKFFLKASIQPKVVNGYQPQIVLMNDLGLTGSGRDSLAGKVSEAGFDSGPVDDLPERGEVGRTTVLVVEVVGMFPHIEGKQGGEALSDGVFGIGVLGNDKTALWVGTKPYPSASKEGGAFLLKLLLEGIDAAKILFEKGGKLGTHGLGSGRELLEIEGVVEHLTGIVEEAALRLADNLGKREVFESAAGEELVEVVDISLKVLAVVEGKGLHADDIAEGLVGKGHHGKLTIGGNKIFHNSEGLFN